MSAFPRIRTEYGPGYLRIRALFMQWKLKMLFGTLTVAEEDCDTIVNTRANSIIIPAGKLLQVPCKADIGVIERRRPTIL